MHNKYSNSGVFDLLSSFICEDVKIYDFERIIERLLIEGVGDQANDEDKLKNWLNTTIKNGEVYFADEGLNPVSRAKANTALIDLGYFNSRNIPLFILLQKRKNGFFTGAYVSTPLTIMKLMYSHLPEDFNAQKEAVESINSFYEKTTQQRIKKNLCDVKEWVYEHYEADDEIKPVYRNNNDELSSIFSEKEIINPSYNSSNVDDNESLPTFFGNVSEITKDIYKQLNYEIFKTPRGLEHYLNLIAIRIPQLISNSMNDYFIINEIKSVIVNSGLINQYGDDIKIMYRLNLTTKTYSLYKIIESKGDFIKERFTKQQASIDIKPITFFDDGMELLEITMDDIDISYKNLVHIIEERNDRIPDALRHASKDIIGTRLQQVVEQNIKMQQRDRTYAKPIYSPSLKKISWIMPLHFNGSLKGDPELVMCLRKVDEFYEVKTIITYDDDVKDSVTALSLYSELW